MDVLRYKELTVKKLVLSKQNFAVELMQLN